MAEPYTTGSPEPFREEVQLTPEMTHVVLFPGDRLAIRTDGEGRPTIQVSGRIPARHFCTYPKHQGCFVSVRVAGTGGTSKIHLVEPYLSDSRIVQGGLPDMEWSKVIYLSHDDKIAFETPPPENDVVVIDLEVVRVEPGDRLRGRYDRGE